MAERGSVVYIRVNPLRLSDMSEEGTLSLLSTAAPAYHSLLPDTTQVRVRSGTADIDHTDASAALPAKADPQDQLVNKLIYSALSLVTESACGGALLSQLEYPATDLLLRGGSNLATAANGGADCAVGGVPMQALLAKRQALAELRQNAVLTKGLTGGAGIDPTAPTDLITVRDVAAVLGDTYLLTHSDRLMAVVAPLTPSCPDFFLCVDVPLPPWGVGAGISTASVLSSATGGGGAPFSTALRALDTRIGRTVARVAAGALLDKCVLANGCVPRDGADDNAPNSAAVAAATDSGALPSVFSAVVDTHRAMAAERKLRAAVSSLCHGLQASVEAWVGRLVGPLPPVGVGASDADRMAFQLAMRTAAARLVDLAAEAQPPATTSAGSPACGPANLLSLCAHTTPLLGGGGGARDVGTAWAALEAPVTSQHLSPLFALSELAAGSTASVVGGGGPALQLAAGAAAHYAAVGISERGFTFADRVHIDGGVGGQPRILLAPEPLPTAAEWREILHGSSSMSADIAIAATLLRELFVCTGVCVWERDRLVHASRNPRRDLHDGRLLADTIVPHVALLAAAGYPAHAFDNRAPGTITTTTTSSTATRISFRLIRLAPDADDELYAKPQAGLHAFGLGAPGLVPPTYLLLIRDTSHHNTLAVVLHRVPPATARSFHRAAAQAAGADYQGEDPPGTFPACSPLQSMVLHAEECLIRLADAQRRALGRVLTSASSSGDDGISASTTEIAVQWGATSQPRPPQLLSRMEGAGVVICFTHTVSMYPTTSTATTSGQTRIDGDRSVVQLLLRHSNAPLWAGADGAAVLSSASAVGSSLVSQAAVDVHTCCESIKGGGSTAATPSSSRQPFMLCAREEGTLPLPVGVASQPLHYSAVSVAGYPHCVSIMNPGTDASPPKNSVWTVLMVTLVCVHPPRDASAGPNQATTATATLRSLAAQALLGGVY